MRCSSQQNATTVNGNNGNDTSCKMSHYSLPCKTLHTALEAVGENDIIHIHNGTYPLTDNTITTLKNRNNVTITGDGSDVTTVECENGTGFGFINVTNINISGLTLSGCGQLRNSTTVNTTAINDSSNSVMFFRAALYFEDVINATIDNVVVNNSIGMGVAMYDVTGNVTVTNSIFRNNSVPSYEVDTYPGGGGFSVEFTYCKQSDKTHCCNATKNKGAFYFFDSCIFDHNTASTLHKTHSSYPNQTFGIGNQQFGRGGGLSVFFKGCSVQNVIRISNCTFDHNEAIWGGGFHSDIVDYSTGNVLTIEHSNFANNHCDYDDRLITTGTGGGGVRIAFLFYDPRSKVTNNFVQFIKCRFQSNRAYYGGGLSCRISKEDFVVVASNSLELVNCTWVENIARTGSGVDIISHVFPHGLSPVVKIVNCNFTANNNSYSKMTRYPLGIGALYADSIPVNFSGNCIFHGNKDSAIAGMDTYFRFTNNTSAVFSDNRGWHGAGMALLGNAYFIVHHNTSLQFINNSAETKGGAIYYINSGQKDFVSTQRCLLYYYDISVQNFSNWNTTFNFSGNNATYGHSIYCTTLLTCIWNNIPGSVVVGDEEDILQVFNWSGIFYYDKVNLSKQIATDTLNISFGTNKAETESIKIPPGKSYLLKNINLVDDRGRTTHPAIIAEIFASDTSVSSVDFIDNASNYSVIIHGNITANISLHLRTVNNRPYFISLNVAIDDCPPGFYYPYNDGESLSEKVCKCSSSNSSEAQYGITDCDNKQLVAYLNPHFWAGYVHFENNKFLVTSDCPQGYCSDTKVKLPDNSSCTALETLVCSNNRSQTLCGSCLDGHYVYANSPTYQCGQCNDALSKHGVLILIVSQYLPLTLMMCFIIFFDISLVDGPLNSFILFCQIFVTLPLYDKTGLPTQGQHFASALLSITNFMYNIWDLKFFEQFVPHFCVLKVNSTLPVLIKEYVPAVYMLFLCVMFFNVVPWIYNCCARSRMQTIQNCALKMERMCIRFRYHWSVKNSVIHSLTTFLVLSYARITLVTFILLTPSSLYGPGGQDSPHQKRVVWLDGTMSYFGSDHLPYALSALFILIIFVLIPPLLLLSYPLLPVLMTRLGVQDYWIVKKLIINPLSKCVPIFDAFQSCYKDEYRFFAGLLFVYRILALAVFAFTPTTALNLAWLHGFLLIVLLLHCTCQPYKKKWHNFIEASIFTILASLTLITFYRLFQAETTDTPTNASFWIQIVLLYCPLVYFIVYTSVKVFLKLQPKIMVAKHTLLKLFGYNNTNTVADLLNSRQFPARMEGDDDNYSSTSESTSESTVPDDDDSDDDDDGQQQQQPRQKLHEQDDDVEMILPVACNDADDNHSNVTSPYDKTWATL